MRNAILPAAMIFAWSLGFSQTFDAASVKPATLPAPDGRGMIMMQGPSGGPGTKDPGRIHYPYMTMKNILMNAYDVKSFQITGPPWLDSERFDITATMPPDTTKEQFRAMLQNLLAERFKLTIHRDTKDLPMYSLTVAKSGPKMKESAEVPAPKDDGDASPPPPLPLPSQPKIGPDGFPILPLPAGGRGRLFMMMMPGRTRLVGQQQTIQDLATRLTNLLSRPVVDATGLKAKYDFTLTFSLEGLNMQGPMGPVPAGGAVAVGRGGRAGDAPDAFVPDGEAPPDLFTAVQAQLGLKLEAKKGPVEMIVIDRIEKTPTEN
jgi:uncharacterized protein (TIGR03435 family)